MYAKSLDNSKSIKTTYSILDTLINPIQKNHSKISVLDINGNEIKDETVATTLKIVIIIHYLYLLSQLVKSLQLLIICIKNILSKNKLDISLELVQLICPL